MWTQCLQALTAHRTTARSSSQASYSALLVRLASIRATAAPNWPLKSVPGGTSLYVDRPPLPQRGPVSACRGPPPVEWARPSPGPSRPTGPVGLEELNVSGANREGDVLEAEGEEGREEAEGEEGREEDEGEKGGKDGREEDEGEKGREEDGDEEEDEEGNEERREEDKDEEGDKDGEGEEGGRLEYARPREPGRSGLLA
jgi:hypothetical protein